MVLMVDNIGNWTATGTLDRGQNGCDFGVSPGW